MKERREDAEQLRYEDREEHEMEVFRDHGTTLEETTGARSGSEGEDRQQLLPLDRKLDDEAQGWQGASTLEGEKGGGRDGKKELKKDMTLLSMIAFVIGVIIGSGIFITPTAVLDHSGSFGVALITWVVGAFLAMGGGLSYCELGLLLKNSGGEYAYLKEAYNFGRPDKVCLAWCLSV